MFSFIQQYSLHLLWALRWGLGAGRHRTHSQVGKPKLNRYYLDPPLRSAILCREGQGCWGEQIRVEELSFLWGLSWGDLRVEERPGTVGTELGERSRLMCRVG